jgi:hypothetical protein
MDVHHPVQTLVVCMAVLCLSLSIAACDSSDRPSGMTEPSPLTIPLSSIPLSTPGSTALSGQVFEVTAGGRVPLTNFPILVVVVTTSSSPPSNLTMRWRRERTTTGPDGRYNMPQLPAGSAAILASSATHRQVCAAGADLGSATQLDVEVTPRTNPQPSPTMPSLRITGQIYEQTRAGRMGIPGVEIGLDHHGPDSPFFDVLSDAHGRYTACGIPANWPIAFSTGKAGYADTYAWHQFTTDTALDIELKRP